MLPLALSLLGPSSPRRRETTPNPWAQGGPMSDFLFGEGVVRWLWVLLAVLLVIAGAIWVARRFSAERLGGANSRGRQPRLAVIDAATVDSRRRLILIRRDNVEHLLMIGGP